LKPATKLLNFLFEGKLLQAELLDDSRGIILGGPRDQEPQNPTARQQKRQTSRKRGQSLRVVPPKAVFGGPPKETDRRCRARGEREASVSLASEKASVEIGSRE
jgi:hypothetical protein